MWSELFGPEKIHRPQPGLNPRTLDIEASTLPRDHLGRLPPTLAVYNFLHSLPVGRVGRDYPFTEDEILALCDNGKWRIRYNSELYIYIYIYIQTDIIKTIKILKLRWTGHIMRIPEENPVKKLTLLWPEGSRRAGRPKLRWLDGVKEDLRTLGIRGWRRRALDRDRWKEFLTAARAQNGCNVISSSSSSSSSSKESTQSAETRG